MTAVKEAKEIGERLLRHSQSAKENPEVRDAKRHLCREELALAEVLMASKHWMTPLETRNLFKEHLPEDVKRLIGGDENE